MDSQAAMKEFQEAVVELNAELQRMSRNIQAVTQYQASVFQATKVLCSWMDNTEALARHRSRLPVTSADTE